MEMNKINKFFFVFPCICLIFCFSLFTTVLWWVSKIVIQLMYPFIFTFYILFCSFTQFNFNSAFFNTMKVLWCLRTQCCQAINAEMWKIRIFISMLISEELVIQDIVELKQELVNSQNAMQSLKHELNADILNNNAIDAFRIKINLAIECAETKALENIYKLRVIFIAKKLDISENSVYKKVNTSV